MSELRPALILFAIFTLITGIVYPLTVTGIGQALFGNQANGSLIESQGKTVGSKLVGQAFFSPQYFWSRPSATSPQPYNGAASSGSNQGPTNPALQSAVKDRIAALRAADPTNESPVPVDLVTASGSGLDPHISLAAAEYQIARVARARKLAEADVRELVRTMTEGRTFRVLGEPRINVLQLNLTLDAKYPRPPDDRVAATN